MSRPKPTIIITHQTPETNRFEEILVADAIYAVFYRGEPINVRLSRDTQKGEDVTVRKVTNYIKCSYSNSGHAFNLANRLNRQFGCEDFTVHRLAAGERIQEGG